MNRMTRRRSFYLIGGIAMIWLMSFTHDARATEVVALWSSGPAIITPVGPFSSSTQQPLGTMIFGRLDGSNRLGFVRSDGLVWRSVGDQFGITTGDMDGDPAATYLPNGDIVWCVHRWGIGTPMVCGQGVVQGEEFPAVVNRVDPKPIGAGTFNAGSSPAIVAVGTDVYVFARGQDEQLWYARLDASSAGHLATNGWAPLPHPPVQAFFGSPGVVKTTAGGGILQVCARQTGGTYICVTYAPSNGFSSWFSTYVGLGQTASSKPALTKSSNATYLFTINDASPNDALYEYSLDGFGWFGFSHVPIAYGFFRSPDNGLAALATTANTMVLMVGRGGDHAFYLSTSDNGFTVWSQIRITYN